MWTGYYSRGIYSPVVVVMYGNGIQDVLAMDVPATAWFRAGIQVLVSMEDSLTYW